MRGRSIQLGRIFGIRVGVNPSWFVVLFVLIWLLSDQYKDVFPGEDTKAFVLATASALLLFFCVLLHELGHAIVARRNNIGIAGIDLWLFGGIATMTREPDTPGAAFRVSAAGPAVTLLIAAGSFIAGAAIWGWNNFLDAVVLSNQSAYGSGEVLLGYVAIVNTGLLLFNLIPGYPLDGGAMLRALAWWRTGDRLRATRFAARSGRFFAYLMMAAGVLLVIRGWFFSGIWLLLIGNFFVQAARGTEMQTRITSQLEGLNVADVMDAEPVAVRSDAKLDTVLDEFFLRYRWPWFPVIDRTGRFLGLVIREKVDEVPEDQRHGWTVDEVMSKDAEGALRVRTDAPLDTLLGREGLRTLGALMAVDGEGVLRGVVTVDQVRKALRPTTPAV
ncbi:MAG TPA: site-2 protease family protein [Candidatus Dormibacteraeota bacterium]|nr:site-2 protease family protein [Candidatus Dormibacteraeota bacterium]